MKNKEVMEVIENDDDLIYSIIFDIPKEDKIEVSRFVDGMKDCLEALEEINHAIVGSIDNSIQIVSYIEALEGGSIIYKLKDRLKKESIEIAVATTAALHGEYSHAVGLLLKNAKGIYIDINNEKIEKKEKEQKICTKIKEELEKSKINNELKGYLLDEKQLMKAIKHFSKGVKKTDGNVFWQKNDNEKRIRIDYSLCEEDNETNNNEEISENAELQTENTITDIYNLLTPTNKENCLWELSDDHGKMKCEMNDKEFFNNYVNNKIKLGGKENLKITMNIKTFLDNGKMKKKYIILKCEVIEIKGLFD